MGKYLLGLIILFIQSCTRTPYIRPKRLEVMPASLTCSCDHDLPLLIVEADLGERTSWGWDGGSLWLATTSLAASLLGGVTNLGDVLGLWSLDLLGLVARDLLDLLGDGLEVVHLVPVDCGGVESLRGLGGVGGRGGRGDSDEAVGA